MYITEVYTCNVNAFQVELISDSWLSDTPSYLFQNAKDLFVGEWQYLPVLLSLHEGAYDRLQFFVFIEFFDFDQYF